MRAAERPGAVGRMPAVWRGRRRLLLSTLVVLGVVQAAVALILASAVSGVIDRTTAAAAGSTGIRGSDLILLIGSVACLAVARWSEQVVGEELGQDYVFEVRRRLIGSALAGDGSTSLGVVVTRASNDLTAIRSWISQGIVPLVTGVPLISVILTVLALTSPAAGLAVGVPVVVLVAAFIPLSRLVFARARALRRKRGRMSAKIADTVRARESIAATGAAHRELAAVDRESGKVVDAAVGRAQATGAVRALALAAASLASVGIVLCGAMGLLDPAQMVSCMTLVGIIATPLADLGRVIEYRQNYQAARRVQAPLMAEAARVEREERSRARRWKQESARPAVSGEEGVRIERVRVGQDVLPSLHARPGEVVLVRSDDPGHAREALRAVVGARNPVEEAGGSRWDEPQVRVDGLDLTRAPDRVRRTLLGFASAHVPLERGTLRRVVGLRDPDASTQDVLGALERAGLGAAVEALPQGVHTRLKNDGRPLGVAQRARVKLARALMGEPPLLVVDSLAADLDEDGRRVLAGVLREHAGVALVVGGGRLEDLGPTRVWDVGSGAGLDLRPGTDAEEDDEPGVAAGGGSAFAAGPR